MDCFAALAMTVVGVGPAFGQMRTDLLTLSTVVQPPVGFSVLPYANANAPKGGSLTIDQGGDFDNLNPFITQGTAPVSVSYVWQPLFKSSDTDSVTAYAELAQSVTIDGNRVIFKLDPRAKFSDGTKVTAGDVVWTFNTLITQGLPFFAGYYANVASVAAPDDETAVFTLKPGAGRDLPIDIAGMEVLPEHFWKGRNFADPLRDIPVGSGPYQVSKISWGNSISYTHVKNWWAEDIPSDKGFYNFDNFTELYFQNPSVALQAFKAGQIDVREADSAKEFATGYDFDAVRNGQVKLERVPVSLPTGMYGLVMNTRRPVFADVRVRHALSLALDFQWMDRVLFYGVYVRQHSYFSNTPLASSGLPGPDELKLLNPFRGKIPDAVFTTPYTLPVTDGSGYNLPQLEQAMTLLNQAGWHVKNFKLVNAQGQQMKFGILLDAPGYDRIAIAYAADLALLGIDVSVRDIDVATYQRELNIYDYDMISVGYPATAYPGGEQADYFGCASAKQPGGDNFAGVCSRAIDAMIADEVAAPDANAKKAAIGALDRLLLNGWYMVPAWEPVTLPLAIWQYRVDKPAAPVQMGYDYALWWHK